MKKEISVIGIAGVGAFSIAVLLQKLCTAALGGVDIGDHQPGNNENCSHNKQG